MFGLLRVSERTVCKSAKTLVAYLQDTGDSETWFIVSEIDGDRQYKVTITEILEEEKEVS